MAKRPFIIDCDTGTDDAIAIMAAFGCREITVRAVTSVNGNVKEEYTSRNNLNIVHYLGLNTEVMRGAQIPFYPRGNYYDTTHGATGLGNVVLPDAPEEKFSKEIASEAIWRIAGEEDGELELLVIGPMTNIAIAISNHPGLVGKIKHIWAMAGSVVGGNCSTTAEFNIWADPVSAKLVFAAGIPITMIGLDVTEKAVLNRADAEEIRSFGNRAGILTANILDYMLNRYKVGGEDAMMHDALALAAAVKPECLVCRDYFVDVECGGQYTAGHTMVDVRGRLGKQPNASVALELDLAAFKSWLKECIRQCGTV